LSMKTGAKQSGRKLGFRGLKLRGGEDRELGFGSSTTDNIQRVMNPDGSSNIRRIGLVRWDLSHAFHRLVTMRWGSFLLVVFSAYMLVNFLFAIGYMLMGIEQLGLTPTGDFWIDYREAFFFSAQTYTTVGYGRVNPSGIGANMLASVESLAGVLSFALATGLLYGRFSKPSASIAYSEKVLVSPYKETGKGLMFRLANGRMSHLIENEIQVILAINVDENGTSVRRFRNLELELNKISILSMMWTVVHPIDDRSPLFGLGEEDLILARAELIVLFKAVDETYNQQVYNRRSYFFDDFVWNARFRPAFFTAADGRISVDIRKVGDYELLS